MSIVHKHLGNRIRQQRIDKHLTQEKLAEMVGISTSFMGLIERGCKQASLETFVSICIALQTSPDCLLQDSIKFDCKFDNTIPTKHIDLLHKISDLILEYQKK